MTSVYRGTYSVSLTIAGARFPTSFSSCQNTSESRRCRHFPAVMDALVCDNSGLFSERPTVSVHVQPVIPRPELRDQRQ